MLDIDDPTLVEVSLAAIPSIDRHAALQRRQRVMEVLLQKIEVDWTSLD